MADDKQTETRRDELTIQLPIRSGEVCADLVMHIDLARLAQQIGPGTMNNKSRTAVLMRGAITARAINFRAAE